ncbi:MAG: hypothetical protein GY716_08440 [bacterium]|nr:hypothetical protein [bacterium]
MASPAESEAGAAAGHLLLELVDRLTAAETLATTVRSCLQRGDASGIESATARLETTVQEFKLLAQEYARLAVDPDAAELADGRAALEAAATRLARGSAMTGGLLERMLTVSRGLLGLLSGATDGTYLESGRTREPGTRGARLWERI